MAPLCEVKCAKLWGVQVLPALHPFFTHFSAVAPPRLELPASSFSPRSSHPLVWGAGQQFDVNKNGTLEAGEFAVGQIKMRLEGVITTFFPPSTT